MPSVRPANQLQYFPRTKYAHLKTRRFLPPAANFSASLPGAHRRTSDPLFRHPAMHNLAWREVRALPGELGQVTEA